MIYPRDVMLTKAELRRHLLARRAMLTPAEIAQHSTVIAAHVGALLSLGLLLTRVEAVWASAKGIMIVFSGSYLRQRTDVVWHLAYRWCHACPKHRMISVCMAL